MKQSFFKYKIIVISIGVFVILAISVFLFMLYEYNPADIEKLPKYPNGVSLNINSLSKEKSIIGSCSNFFSGSIVEAYTSTDGQDQILNFYRQYLIARIGEKKLLEEPGIFNLKAFPIKGSLPRAAFSHCFINFSRLTGRKPTNLIYILNPANPDEKAYLERLFPSLNIIQQTVLVIGGYEDFI